MPPLSTGSGRRLPFDLIRGSRQAPRFMTFRGTGGSGPAFPAQRRMTDMLRILLVLAVIALGADAIMNNGAYTQAAWHQLQTIKLDAGKDGAPPPEKRI